VPAPDVALVGLYPTEGTHDGRSGVAPYTAHLARALHAQGANVAVVAERVSGDGRGAGAEERDGGVRIRRAFRRGPLALPQAVSAAVATGAPIVHVQHELFLYGGASSIPGVVPALARRYPPVIFTLHHVVDPGGVDGAFTQLHRVRAPAVLARHAINGVQNVVRRRARAVVVLEHSFTAHLHGARAIPHGIERVDRLERAAARATVGLDPDCFAAMCFGFVAPYKGIEAALDAAAIAGSRVEVVIAGGEHPRFARRGGQAPDRSGYLRELHDRAPANVRFTGYVPEDAVRSWFSAVDVALLPYPRPFSSSGALALALAYGTPTLLSTELAACIDAPEIMATTRDPRGLADRLVELASDPRALDGLRSATAALARDRSWPLVAARHLELYEEVIHDDRASRRRIRAAQPG